MSTDIYRARTMALQEIFGQVSRAIKQANLVEANLVTDVVSFDGGFCPLIRFPDSLSSNQVAMLLENLPLAAVSSRFLPEQFRSGILADLAKLCSKVSYDLKRVEVVTLKRLREIQPFILGLYTETLQLAKDIDSTFSDNLLLNVCDRLIEYLPAGLALVQDERKLGELGRQVALSAADIRGQITWGLVEDFVRFRTDVLTMAQALYQLESALGVKPEEYGQIDFARLSELAQFCLSQPVQIMYMRQTGTE